MYFTSVPIGAKHKCPKCGEPVDLRGTYGAAKVDGDTKEITHEACNPPWDVIDEAEPWAQQVQQIRCHYMIPIADGMFKMCGKPIVSLHYSESAFGFVPLCKEHSTEEATPVNAFQGFKE